MQAVSSAIICSVQAPPATMASTISCVTTAPWSISHCTWPPAKSTSWNISAPGRLVQSIPKAMGMSNSGSKPFFTAR